MDGKTIKDALRREGRQVSELADFLGISQQNLHNILNKDSIKTSTLEGAAKFLGKPISFFYNEGNIASVGRDGNASINDSMLLEEIAAQRKLTAMAMEQNGQLLKIIENLTKK